MNAKVLGRAFRRHWQECVEDGEPPVYWLSVNAVPDMSLAAISHHSKRPNPYLRRLTVKAINDAGFAIFETPGRREVDGHCDVFKPGVDHVEPSPDDLDKLVSALTSHPSFENPNPTRSNK